MASTEPLADVIPIASAPSAGGSGFSVVDKRGKNLARGVGKRAVKTAHELSREQITSNVRNLAGAGWWHMQGAAQRGDHVEVSRQSLGRSRLLATAANQGIHVGY